MLDRVGMGKLMDTLSDLKLDELLSTPPPGLDEAVAISKVVEFVESEEYARFTRIVFDTAPTGHTLRMLSLPDFVAATLQKVQTLQTKLGTGGPIIQAIFGNPEGLQSSAKQLQELERRVLSVSRLFRYANAPTPACHSSSAIRTPTPCRGSLCGCTVGRALVPVLASRSLPRRIAPAVARPPRRSNGPPWAACYSRCYSRAGRPARCLPAVEA